MAVNVQPHFYNQNNRVPIMQVSQITVPLAASLLLPNNLNRVRCSIENIGGQSIFIGPDAGVTVANGYKLPAGNTLAINTTVEVWAIAQTAVCLVCTLVELLPNNG